MLAAVGRPLAPVIDRIAARLLAGPGLFLVPALCFGLYRATAGRAWGETHIVWADGYAHLQYGTAFLLGLLLARQDQAWALMRRFRLALLIFAVGALTVALAIVDPVEDSPGWPGFAFAFLREAYAWAAICALFGYANRYIRKGSPSLSLLSEAVFPAYIVHQTTIILAGHLMKPLGLRALAEAVILLVLTAASCAAAYGLALAVPFMRLPLGLKPRRAQAAQLALSAAR
jgi:surface polysaccharide O-acyltransferase-like enzyme